MSEASFSFNGQKMVLAKDINRELYAENTITWASVTKFPDERFFLITKDIFDLETYLSTHIDNHRQRIDGTGENHKLRVLRDSLHHTRRYEYPYAILNMPLEVRNVLDVGGGSSFSYYMGERVEYCLILDIDQKVGDEHQSVITHTRKFRNVAFRLGDVREIPYPDDSFDYVTCISTLEHMDDKNLMLALSEMMRVAKPDGVIVVTMDVSLTKSDTINLDDVKQLGERLKMPILPITPSTLYSSIGDDLYVVACMQLTGFKGGILDAD